MALIAYYNLPFVSYDTEFSPLTGTLYNPVGVPANGFSPFIQFSALLTFITLVIATLLIFGNKSSATEKTQVVIQRRRAIYAMIGMSVLSILIYILTVISNNNSAVPFDSIDAGFWVYLLGLGTVIVGSIMALHKLSSPLMPPTQLPPQSTIHR